MNNNDNKNNNPFLNNGKSPFGNLGASRTKPAIKWIIIAIFGILPFVLLIFLVGPDATVADNWRKSENFLKEIDYGMMWLLSIVVIILSALSVSLIAFFSRDVRNDVIPWTLAFLFMGAGFYVIPLGSWSSLGFIFIAPILFIVGAAIGGIGIFIVALRKVSKQMKEMNDNPEMKKQMDETMKQFQKQGGMFGQQPKPPKDTEENYEDNPFVDVEEEKEDKDK